MKVAHVKISNILGIENLEFDAGQFTQISGRNGEGKTSALAAIRSVISGGTDATLLRKGAEVGEVVIVMDDGSTAKRRITPKTNAVTVERNGEKPVAGANVMRQLTDALSVNPVDFLRAPKKQRMDVLLESLPMSIDENRVNKIVGFNAKINPNLLALDELERVRKLIYDDRTGTNRAIKEKASTISQLTASLPDGESADPIESAEALELRISQINDAQKSEVERIATKLSSLKAEMDGRIEARRIQIRALEDEISKERLDFADIEVRAARQREIKLAEFSDERAPVQAKITAIRQTASSAAKAEQTRQTILKLKDEERVLAIDAARQTKALDDLAAYKEALLADLPINGLEVIDGEVFRNGIPFDNLNTAQQVEIAVSIAKLRAGELKVMLVDGLELLDSERFSEFRRQALDSELQLIVTRVSDDALTVINF